MIILGIIIGWFLYPFTRVAIRLLDEMETE